MLTHTKAQRMDIAVTVTVHKDRQQAAADHRKEGRPGEDPRTAWGHPGHSQLCTAEPVWQIAKQLFGHMVLTSAVAATYECDSVLKVSSVEILRPKGKYLSACSETAHQIENGVNAQPWRSLARLFAEPCKLKGSFPHLTVGTYWKSPWHPLCSQLHPEIFASVPGWPLPFPTCSRWSEAPALDLFPAPLTCGPILFPSSWLLASFFSTTFHLPLDHLFCGCSEPGSSLSPQRPLGWPCLQKGNPSP